ncbi:aldo/keto reductase [Bradyrhizobium sp. INPA01-394B]|uniref:Aldo/keto reductase n=1 Tax=Bradyrhizobium campsiandrae TaxID=1729892 RepID=A0ABR7U595_9BRAD|nr:aldo/keto reductase [Bradyrhizobium campsiandrae]MBC9879897.1 aldo/keto reductase [Bradyrhizobium campsiandrae]MBC9978582.1 aldo/keto reductase [Bradyrhizobium campsiandrae]
MNVGSVTIPSTNPQSGRSPAPPQVGLGTRLLLGDRCTDVVLKAIEIGYRYIDTSPSYGNEDAAGRAIDLSGIDRREMFVTTKVERDELRPERLLASAQRSLDTLGLDWIDLLLIHWPNADVPISETLSAMGELQRCGVVSHIGVANFPVAMLDETIAAAGRAGTRLFANQIEVHPSLPQRRLVAACTARGVRAIAYSPMGREDLGHTAVLDVAKRTGRTPAQVVLRWHIQNGVLPVPIPETGEPGQIASQFDLFEFELSNEDMAALAGVGPERRYFSPPWAPAWDPQD